MTQRDDRDQDHHRDYGDRPRGAAGAQVVEDDDAEGIGQRIDVREVVPRRQQEQRERQQSDEVDGGSRPRSAAIEPECEEGEEQGRQQREIPAE